MLNMNNFYSLKLMNNLPCKFDLKLIKNELKIIMFIICMFSL